MRMHAHIAYIRMMHVHVHAHAWHVMNTYNACMMHNMHAHACELELSVAKKLELESHPQKNEQNGKRPIRGAITYIPSAP